MAIHGTLALQAGLTYRIGEVASLAQVEPHVLRYWETEFPALRPAKTPSGQRFYSEADVRTVLSIKRLLYEEGFTIAGARKQLESPGGNSAEPVAVPSAEAVTSSLPASHVSQEQLLRIRAELVGLLTLLSRR